MGNDQSQLSGLELENKAVEVTDFWTHHSATVNLGNITNLSVFIGEPLLSGSLWVSQTPLEKSSKNLMLHRHPCILKYVSSWNKGSKYYLAVENVRPLAHVLASQNSLQICVGLHSILKALVFLHEKAFASHNNVCIASIYVTKDGNWKLGGMEYLCRFQDMSSDYMAKTRTLRYSKGIDPNEDKLLLDLKKQKEFVDLYAFANLALEILKEKTDDDIPTVSSFKDLCKNDLQNSNFALRPKFSTLLDHPFFNHEFISIHSFLTELPLKTDEEKSNFFKTLRHKLTTFDEEVVGRQLGSLLLSRMVLINKTAQNELLPYILNQKEDSESGLFTTENFRRYLTPKLLEIFCVRDAQIRLLLLDHFAQFMPAFSTEELQLNILPELLVGIKDTNDHLVSVTLRALADLISILGAATVIGGKRAKLFNDGRPGTNSPKTRPHQSSKQNHVQQNTEQSEIGNSFIRHDNISSVESSQILTLPERPSPDGEEGESSTEEIDRLTPAEVDNWEDWDVNEETAIQSNYLTDTNSTETTSSLLAEDTCRVEKPLDVGISSMRLSESNSKKLTLPDINDLDIKNQKKVDLTLDSFDFFQDMEPIIERSNKYAVPDLTNNDISKSFDLSVKESENQEEGWGEEEW